MSQPYRKHPDDVVQPRKKPMAAESELLKRDTDRLIPKEQGKETTQGKKAKSGPKTGDSTKKDSAKKPLTKRQQRRLDRQDRTQRNARKRNARKSEQKGKPISKAQREAEANPLDTEDGTYKGGDDSKETTEIAAVQSKIDGVKEKIAEKLKESPNQGSTPSKGYRTDRVPMENTDLSYSRTPGEVMARIRDGRQALRLARNLPEQSPESRPAPGQVAPRGAPAPMPGTPPTQPPAQPQTFAPTPGLLRPPGPGMIGQSGVSKDAFNSAMGITPTEDAAGKQARLDAEYAAGRSEDPTVGNQGGLFPPQGFGLTAAQTNNIMNDQEAAFQGVSPNPFSAPSSPEAVAAVGVPVPMNPYGVSAPGSAAPYMNKSADQLGLDPVPNRGLQPPPLAGPGLSDSFKPPGGGPAYNSTALGQMSNPNLGSVPQAPPTGPAYSSTALGQMSNPNLGSVPQGAAPTMPYGAANGMQSPAPLGQGGPQTGPGMPSHPIPPAGTPTAPFRDPKNFAPPHPEPLKVGDKKRRDKNNPVLQKVAQRKAKAGSPKQIA